MINLIDSTISANTPLLLPVSGDNGEDYKKKLAEWAKLSAMERQWLQSSLALAQLVLQRQLVVQVDQLLRLIIPAANVLPELARGGSETAELIVERLDALVQAVTPTGTTPTPPETPTGTQKKRKTGNVL